ncbi:penicillin acylase family protein [Aliikangiella coralliicola]|uniref:Penicillin acylase family protein n=1 Tax=Aliikangiella coralliicola TaxID=2592383 RepID=A0A545TV45_9GAMM|nr:penicillin acylase family protein [Aliikangiella coralliicola]TQV81093.1 penicillin acylase family protein [Aliikangiella coralliicola]
MKPILIRFLIFVILPVGLALVGLLIHFNASLPMTNGTNHIEGIKAKVEIVRDKWGVPHVSAENDLDAFFSIGYLHAQDRLWQLEIQRRLGSGRLSEIFGSESLSNDKMMRTLGFRRLAEQHFSQLSEFAQQSLYAYSAGINAWLLSDDHELPIEFVAFDVQPEKWTPIDSLVWLKVIAWNLSSNYKTEIDRLLLTHELGESKAQALFFGENSIQQSITEHGEIELYQSLAELRSFTQEFQQQTTTNGNHIGSNAWVVSGDYTESGLPLLANDPHVQMKTPSMFYLAHLKGGNLNAVGATFPGLPFIVFGHNDFISWGGASFAADVQDLYIEQVKVTNPDQYIYDGETREMEIVEETILVKQDFPSFLRAAIPPQKWRARSTIHGPIISDVIGISSNQLISLKWTGFDPQDKTYEALLQINYASDWPEFNSAVKLAVTPTLAFVYADKKNNIGMLVGGKIPIRKQGYGTAPNNGWNSDEDWRGYVPFEENPNAFNPQNGYLVLANQRLVDNSYPYFVTADWPSSHRADRIAEKLQQFIEQTPKELNLEQMKVIQGDRLSLAAVELLPYLLAVEPADDKQAEALSYLKNWNGEFGLESVGATIFETWYMSFRGKLLQDDLWGDLLNASRADYLLAAVDDIPHSFYLKVLKNKDVKWCDNVRTVNRESCEDTISAALDDTISTLEKFVGSSMDDWEWQQVHQAYFPHTPFSRLNLLDIIFDERIPSVGDNYTINLGESSFSMTDGYEQYVGATYRQLVDLGNLDKSRFSITPGQSGNIFSAHYNDSLEAHRDMSFIKMKLSDGEGEKLILLPQ